MDFYSSGIPSSSPMSAAALREGLWKTYFPPRSAFDEMQEPDGSVRFHWQMFVNLLDDLGPLELGRRWETARQLIHDNGVSYNVYGDPAGMDRPWNLDPLPLVYSATDWATIENGLSQRARLLDAIVADIYGPQRLLHDGMLPPELVFAQRGFLRPMFGAQLPQGRWLHFYAADVGRSSDGQMWVLADRTQSPSGTGYTLENRLVVSRALPDVFRDCRIQRLATFFRTKRETLKSLAPHNRDNPRIVLLTPGPFNETYFEQAYLARYLGCTLGEGGDLTVRDNNVFLKTLGGLQQVDVILRRQDDEFCDPLELRSDSALGIAGLVQVIHSGNVAVANALGTGILETPALMMFLPRLAKHLLGEELKLPSVGTYWCGDAAARSHVLANLNRMVIKRSFPGEAMEPVFGSGLSQWEIESLRERIRAQPRDFVGEEQVSLPTSPVFLGGRVEARHVVLRSHLVAKQDGGYAVMPGGLARFSATADSMIVSMQRGGGAKDVWVPANGPVDTFSLLAPTGQSAEITRAGGDLPSRVADNLYWLGRYMERAEGISRLARGITARLADQTFDTSPELPILFATLTHESIPQTSAGPELRPEERLSRILFDDQVPLGLQSTLRSIHGLASLVRDRLSVDTWRIINRFDADFPANRNGGLWLNEIIPALDRLIVTFAAFGGLAMESMTRGYAWRFLDMGRRVERSLATLALLRGTLVSVTEREALLLEAVLEIADSSMTYRRRYMSTLQAALVVDLLLTDDTNPRSVVFQLLRLMEHVDALPRVVSSGSPGFGGRLLMRAITELREVDLQEEVRAQEEGRRSAMDHLFATLSADIYSFSNSISESYLSHAITSRHLAAESRPSRSDPVDPNVKG